MELFSERLRPALHQWNYKHVRIGARIAHCFGSVSNFSLAFYIFLNIILLHIYSVNLKLQINLIVASITSNVSNDSTELPLKHLVYLQCS